MEVKELITKELPPVNLKTKDFALKKKESHWANQRSTSLIKTTKKVKSTKDADQSQGISFMVIDLWKD